MNKGRVCSTWAQEVVRTTDAENVTRPPRRSISDARIDDFDIEADLAEGRTWHVTGAAIERFAAMTNWGYYEAAARFQKVLDVAGTRGSALVGFYSWKAFESGLCVCWRA